MYLTGFADEAGADIRTQIKVTKELGWENIELRNTGFEGDLAGMSDKDFDTLYGLLDEAGVKVNCFGSAIANWAKSIDDPFDITEKEIRACLPRLKKLRCKMVRIMSYVPKVDPETKIELPDDQQEFDERARRVRRIVDMFADEGVLAVHENCRNYGGMSWKHALQLVEAVPGLKLVYDTGNPVYARDMSKGIYQEPVPMQDSWEFYSKVKEHVAYIHIKDAAENVGGVALPNGVVPKHCCTFPGEGKGAVKEIVKDMLDRGYDGGISIEPHVQPWTYVDQGMTEDEAKQFVYIEYGKRFMALLEEIGYGEKI